MRDSKKITVLVLALMGLTISTGAAERPICLRALTFQPGEPVALRLPAWGHQEEPAEGRAHVIVRFEETPTAATKGELERLGLTLLDYLPHDSYLAGCSVEALGAARALETVEWIGIYHPFFKVAGDLLANDLEPAERLYVQLFRDADIPATLDLVRAAGGRVESLVERPRPLLRVELSPDASNKVVRALAAIDAVEWIEPFPDYQLCNDDTQWVVQSGLYAGETTPLYDNGVKGGGQIVAVLDTGCDADACFFYDDAQGMPGEPPNPAQRKIVSYQDIYGLGNWDDHGHGTHTAGSVGGDNFASPGSHDGGDGVALEAKLVIQDAGRNSDIDPPDDMYGAMVDAYDDGARIHSNSWGWPNSAGAYQVHSQQVDQATWDYPTFISVWAMGNEGPQSGTMRAPGTAKSCVAVGATAHGSNAENNASFSSHGPTQDGRLKPEVTVPGENIISARNDGSSGSFNCTTTSMSGTSMAAPGCAGAVALLRQYYADGYWPLGVATPGLGFEPSAALTRATLVNSAENMTGNYTADSGSGHADIPSQGQGWGRVNLDRALYFAGDERDLFIDDETTGLSTGETATYQLAVVSSTEPLEITLAWSDYPSTPEASINLVNDLDLTVTGGGETYVGNVYSGGHSIPGGTADRLNTIECVLIEVPEPGVYQITVTAHAVPEGPQPFALVACSDMAFSDGIVSLDRGLYGCTDTIEIAVSDWDLKSQGTQEVTVASTSEPAGETLLLQESPADSGTFLGTLPTTGGTPHTGALLVAEGDTVTASYIDLDDGMGGTNVEKTDDATVDCTAPQFSAVLVGEITGDSAVITFESDEPASSLVLYGSTVPPVELAESASLVTAHTLTLEGLEEDTYYYFAVGGYDEAGNAGANDDGGLYFRFRTRLVLTAFSDDFELEAGWVEEGDGQWERDVPGAMGGGLFGSPDPQGDHTSGTGKAWGTDLTVDGNYNATSDCSILSPTFSCAGMTGTKVMYWDWLNTTVLLSGGSVYLDVDGGGGTWQTAWSTEVSTESTEWEEREVDISEWADGQAAVRLRFRLVSTALFLTNSGWNVDDLVVEGYGDSGAPTPTPFPTFTPAPPTATPTGGPTAPPGTQTPRPTPDPEDVSVLLELSDFHFIPGDEFLLTAALGSGGEDQGPVPLFVILDVLGDFWFWPSWDQYPPDIDFQWVSLSAAGLDLTILGPFIWPDTGNDSLGGIRFHGAILTEEMDAIRGYWDSVEFGFGPAMD